MTEQTYSSKKSSTSFDLWQDSPPLLSHFDIELTERCNNNCIHCCIRQPEDSGPAKAYELSPLDIKTTLAEAAALGALSVRFTGGEPLLRADFGEIYLAARKLGLKALLFTNATLITPGLAELFRRIPPLERIEVTAYGMTERSYESVTRIKGSYAKFMKGIALLVQHNIPFVIKGALLPSTSREIDEFEAWAGAIPWMQRPPALAMLFNFRDRRDSSDRNAMIKKLRISPKDYLSILNRRRTEYLKETFHFCKRFIGPPGDLLFSCSSGHAPCLDSYGNAQMCLPLRHPETIYSLKQGSLRDALTVFFPKLRETKSINRDYLERCARCFLNGLCEQCPAKSWSEHGTLDTPVEYLCDIAHAEARDLGLLASREKGWHVKDWRERVAKASAKLL
jgi:radical SAM protein with 4Fe4S-binding SPASM domain